MSKKSKAKEAAEIAALVDLRRKSLKETAEQFTVIDGTDDPADKIVKLEKLKDAIDAARKDVKKKQSKITAASGNKRGGIVAGTVIAATVAGCASGGILATPLVFWGLLSLYVVPTVSGTLAKTSAEKKKKKQLQEADPADFAKIMDAQGARASALLDETMINCDLGKLSESPLLASDVAHSRFVNSRQMLSERFQAVVNRAAVAAPPQETAPASTPVEVRPSAIGRFKPAFE